MGLLEISNKCKLSPRERAVAGYIMEGKTNAEIAAVMNITAKTVKFHLTNVYKKTETKGRLALAVLIKAG